jgi:chromosome segregation ATPase
MEELANLENEDRQAKSKLDAIAKSLAAKCSELEQINGAVASNDPLALYSEEIRKVAAEIKTRTWKGQSPFGPLGVFISVKVSEWEMLIEARLGQTLRMFVVDNREDEDQLLAIMKKYDW